MSHFVVRTGTVPCQNNNYMAEQEVSDFSRRMFLVQAIMQL